MTAEIRGLTLHRPWGRCFLLPPSKVAGPKRVENRTWYPRWACQAMHRGIAHAWRERVLWLALHGGQKLDREALDQVRILGWPDLHPGEPGQIVAVCRLARVLDVQALGHRHAEVTAHGWWARGPYLWEVDRVVELPDPVPCRGAQGLWRLPQVALDALVMQRVWQP